MASLGFALRYFFLGRPVEAANQASTEAVFTTQFTNLQGHSQTLSQYRGKFIVLNFWATWCEPCRDEMPELSSFYEANQSKNVVVIGLGIDDLDAINSFQKETPVKYPVFSAEAQGMEIATSLGNNKGVLPYTIIIKPDGSVYKTYFGRISKSLIEQSIQALLH